MGPSCIFRFDMQKADCSEIQDIPSSIDPSAHGTPCHPWRKRQVPYLIRQFAGCSKLGECHGMPYKTCEIVLSFWVN